MLLVKLSDVPRRLFHRSPPPRRSSLTIGGAYFHVLETPASRLGEPGVQRLLASERGKTLFPTALSACEVWKPYAFDARPYRVRALTDALVRRLALHGGRDTVLTVRGTTAYDLLIGAVPHVKTLCVWGSFDAPARAFCEACYRACGTRPRFVKGLPAGSLFADFTAVGDDGLLPVTGGETPLRLAAPPAYYTLPPEAQTPVSWGIDRAALAAAVHAQTDA